MNSVRVGGYVLAGGRSSRMGQDKALLELGGQPLIQLAVEKLSGVCAEVQILSRNSALAAFAPLVGDLHPDTGPIGGLEAALIRTPFDWNLILPVDVPFVPVTLLVWWVEQIAEYEASGVRVAMFRVNGRPQPTVLLLHRSVAPYLTGSIAKGEYKLRSALEEAACGLAREHGLLESRGLRAISLDEELLHELPGPLDEASVSLWFTNLNTPEDLAEAARHLNRRVTKAAHPQTCAARILDATEPTMSEMHDGAAEDSGAIPPAEEPLTAELSADVAPIMETFLDEAAHQNEAVTEGTQLSASDSFISFEHVSKSFGDVHVLKDVSFCVKPGETLCILGRSGVGKSVSLQILMGFIRADSGWVRVAGENICGMKERELQAIRRKVTMVFQSGALFDSITVGENVAFPLRERGDLAEDQIEQVTRGLLEMVGVAGMADVLPSDLSTGMKRSVAIARALASQPEAVLYDEPTTMVDPLMAHLLGNLIQRLKQQLHLTSIVVTHDMRFARKLADRIVFLHEGAVRFFGTVDEMDRSNDELLREFLALDELAIPA